MKLLVEELKEKRTLGDSGLRELLTSEDPSATDCLYTAARETAESRFGRQVYLRALIEWSNICRNDCLYCGIRRSHAEVQRYSLSREAILQCCEKAFRLGLRTFVLQGGENPASSEFLIQTVSEMRASWPDCAITLSLGELSSGVYARLRRAGADRYLLRHETADAAHYAKLHPAGMRLESRLARLHTLRELGYQTGMGMMVGSPFQTIDNLLADIRLLERFRPEMIGIGPFIPHPSTPLSNYPAGSAGLTLRIYAILRLMHPDALIPATTALSTLRPDGRTAGILAGANVIMPNFTPAGQRAAYTLYEGKTAPDVESAENLRQLRAELAAIGWSFSPSRGDYRENT